MSRRTCFLSLIIAVLSLNMPQWVLAYYFGISRPCWYMEWVVVVLLALLAPLVSYFLALILCAAEAYWFASSHFPGLSGFGLIGLLQAALDSRTLNIAYIAMPVVYYAIVIYALWRLLGRRRLGHMVISVLIMTAGIGVQSASTSTANASFTSFNLTTLVLRELSDGNLLRADAKPRIVLSDAESAIGKVDDIGQYKGIGLIIVEALGYYHDRRLNDLLLKRLAEEAGVLVLREGYIQGSSSTVNAELRELCSAVSHGYGVTKIPEQIECLPNILGERGYKTFSMHGGDSKFYNRYLWYSGVGFEESHFLSDYKKIKRCDDNWPGVCDVELSDVYFDKMTGKGSVFGYWLTLNSHHPYGFGDLQKYSRKDCFHYGLADVPKVCANFLTIYELFESISKNLRRKRGGLQGSVFVITGDHSPYFLMDEEKSFLEVNRVPFIVLKIG